MSVYYNEINHKKATWLRELISRNLIAKGEVDERSIVDVRPDDLGNPDWIYCRDDKWRAVKPGLEPLANGVKHRVVKLRGLGDAIVVPQATAFIEAYLKVTA